MILGSSDPTPYDLPAVAVLAVCALVLVMGCLTGARWPHTVASTLRRVALVVALVTVGFVLLATPTSNGFVGAGRLVTIWPAFAIDVLLFVVWSVRAGGP